MRVFVIESASPLDLMDGLSERKTLEQICKMMGHEVVTFFAKSKDEFTTICNYISSIDEIGRNENKDKPICIHISSHGNEDGVLFGKDDLSWEEISESLTPIFSMDYSKDFFLAISACGTDEQKMPIHLKNSFKKNNIKPPKYIFSINQDEVKWRDAVLNWTILYHQIDNLDSNKRTDFQRLLDRIINSGFGNLKYNRWDHIKKKYKSYPTKKGDKKLQLLNSLK
ncbi:hypothetical protein [Neobacillus niacini]|uniref:hypothetical protein n=1 Tax=Neobacillus niacini TaxID=86668 RepID=UPI0007AB4821|nr:hypothetical protein [Neobacillus niacini]